MPRSEVVKRMWVYFKEHNLLVKQEIFILNLMFSNILFRIQLINNGLIVMIHLQKSLVNLLIFTFQNVFCFKIGRKRVRAFGMLKDLRRHMSDPDKQQDQE